MSDAEFDYNANERWYLALTALWAERLRDGRDGAGPPRSPVEDVSFAAVALGLRPGARVLDLACGWGRTTLELARRGYEVVGFDLSSELLEIARIRCAAAGLSIPFVQGTVRRLPDLGRFDAVTAFYDDSVLSFEDEEDNLAALRAVARSLRPGGGFLFGTTDCPPILPPSTSTERGENGLRIVETISFDTATMTGTSIRAHHHADGKLQTFRRVRHHYAPTDASRLFAGVGLTLRGAWNAYDADLPYGSRPEGMVLLAARHAR